MYARADMSRVKEEEEEGRKTTGSFADGLGNFAIA